MCTPPPLRYSFPLCTPTSTCHCEILQELLISGNPTMMRTKDGRCHICHHMIHDHPTVHSLGSIPQATGSLPRSSQTLDTSYLMSLMLALDMSDTDSEVPTPRVFQPIKYAPDEVEPVNRAILRGRYRRSPSYRHSPPYRRSPSVQIESATPDPLDLRNIDEATFLIMYGDDSKENDFES